MKSFYFWYNNIVVFDLLYKLNLKNSFVTPKINSVSLNACLASIVEKPKSVLYPLLAFKLLTYQIPTVCKAKKSLSYFNLRKGMLLGVKTSLRKKFMYNFLCLFVSLVVPTLKKFYFVSKFGCLAIGVVDVFSFPQLSFFRNHFLQTFGLIVNLIVRNGNLLNSKLLLTSLQLPLC